MIVRIGLIREAPVQVNTQVTSLRIEIRMGTAFMTLRTSRCVWAE